tara:strand:+ start:33 stop:473 length:441 start_codon:yes stop_codon:yes gene_type:complete
MQGHNMTLRLKLSDFIEHKDESLIIDLINDAYKINQYKLHLWYHEGTIKPPSLKSFIIRAEKDLNFRTKITNQSEIGRNEFVWYDIISTSDALLSQFSERYRFQYQYRYDKPVDGIIEGLNQFKETLKFCSTPRSEKPIRKQKRND